MIYETKSFGVIQDFEIPISGFLIISTKRHITSFSEFNEEEEKEFLPFLIKVRKAMRDCLGVSKITFVQEEKSIHHFHVWLFPWYEWMGEIGSGLNFVKKIMEYAREKMKDESNLRKIKDDIAKIKNYFNK